MRSKNPLRTSRAVDQKQRQERQQYHDEGIRMADADDWLYLGVRERMFERGNRLGPSQRLFRYPETMFGTFGHFRIVGVTGHFALGVQKIMEGSDISSSAQERRNL